MDLLLSTRKEMREEGQGNEGRRKGGGKKKGKQVGRREKGRRKVGQLKSQKADWLELAASPPGWIDMQETHSAVDSEPDNYKTI